MKTGGREVVVHNLEAHHAAPRCLLRRYGKTPDEYLDRHRSGDWGDLEAFDWRANDRAVEAGTRLFSAYAVSPLNTLWIISEADRSSTCLLLPEDY